MKEYKVSLWVVIKNTVIGIFFTGVVAVLAGFFVENLLIVIGIAVIVALIYIYATFIGARIYIRVDGNDLYIRRGRNEYRFKTDEIAIRAKSSNDDAADLYIHDGTKEEHIDCSLLGHTRFYELLEDLGVIGEKQEAIKLETKKK